RSIWFWNSPFTTLSAPSTPSAALLTGSLLNCQPGKRSCSANQKQPCPGSVCVYQNRGKSQREITAHARRSVNAAILLVFAGFNMSGLGREAVMKVVDESPARDSTGGSLPRRLCLL